MLMDIVELFSRRVVRRLFAVALPRVFCVAVWTQAPTQDQAAKDQQSNVPQSNEQQNQEQVGKSARPTQSSPTQASPAQSAATQESDKPPPPKEEAKITPREAEELFHSVDEILTFDSKQTGLAIKKKVKRKLTSREEVVSYLTKHMDDEDAQRLRRSELVLKKFGLLPRQFDLQKFLVALLREQVAGFYEPKTKTVNLLDWVDAEQQKPVLAHELTHALQDQSFGLEKWMKDQDLAAKKD